MGEVFMRVHNTVQDSIVDGPGLRFVVFTQGCCHGCVGCHNPQTHDLHGGEEISVEALIAQMKNNPLTDGLTLSGGEPFLQIADCTALAAAAKEMGLNVWCYTGFTLEQLNAMPEAKTLLDQIDVLVDGRFIEEEKSLTLKWRGSENQRVIDRKTGELLNV